MKILRILTGASMLIIAAGIVLAQQSAKQPVRSKSPSENTKLAPLGDGFCKLVEGSLLVYAPPETVFDAYVVKVKGQPEQRCRATGNNPYTKGSVTVQLLSKTKGPLGPVKELKLTGSRWNPKLSTIDLVFSDSAVRTVVHAVDTCRGLRVQTFECAPSGSPKP